MSSFIHIGQATTLSVCGLFAMTALVAQSTAVTPTHAVPVQSVKGSVAPVKAKAKAATSAQELMDCMQKVLSASKEAGKYDADGVNAIIKEASESNLSDSDFGALIAMPVKAYPGQIISVVSDSVRFLGADKAKADAVYAVMKSAITAHPKPYTVVIPVRDAVLQLVRNSPVLSVVVRDGSIAIAEVLPDNPITPVVSPGQSESAAGTVVDKKGSHDIGGALLESGGVPINTKPLPPVSSPEGN
ncbi:MAG: hypothetical protein RSE01_00565 [Akkermansia sp.]